VTVRRVEGRTVIVADGQLNTSLCVARSLRRAGYRVIAAGHGSSATGALRSRSVAGGVRVAAGDPGARQIVSLARQEGAVAVMAHYEQTLLALYRAAGAGPPVVVGASPAHLELCVRKSSVLEAAQRVGVPVPETRLLDRGASEDELRALVGSLAGRHGWPLFAKSDTELGVPPGEGSRYVVLRSDADVGRLAAFVRVRGRVLLQERIPGKGCGIAGLFVAGAPACTGGHVRLREAHATGGVSTYCESRVVAGALRSARTLMEALRWTGVAMVEFKIPDRGPPVLMEVNPRLWGTLPLYVWAGADVPLASLEYALDGHMPEAAPFREGRRMRFLVSDLAAIRRQYSGLRRARELALALGETPWTVPDATFCLRDPIPFLVDVGGQVSAMLRRSFALRAPAARP
jgi:predicted ATP-grasp superfamily ATP-dependent carboligase